MLLRFYRWVLDLAGRKHALLFLAIVAFSESSLFPIPPDVMLIPMVLAARNRAWIIAGVCTLASVLGGMAGYGIGALLFEQVGRPILDFYAYGAKFNEFTATYNAWGGWAVFIGGFTFIPYKVITILSGISNVDLMIFTVSSVVARGLRFFIIAFLLWHFGTYVEDFIERRLGILFVAFVIVLIGGILLFNLIF